MKRYLMLFVIGFLVTGCELIDNVFQPEPSVTPTIPKQPEQPPVTVPEAPPVFVESPPQITYTLDWKEAEQTLVQSLLSKVEPRENRLLLIDSIKNNTKSYISSQPLFELISEDINNSGQFALLSRQDLNQGRKALGLPIDDQLATKSKVLGLARYLTANYVLLTTLTGDNQQPQINMQLLLVSSGEIVWSGQAATAKKQVP